MYSVKKLNKEEHEGMLFNTRNYGELVITKYVNNKEVYVKFIETGYETKAGLSDIRNGKVKDRLVPSVCGVGVIGDETTKVNSKVLKEYRLWHNMLERCYCEKLHKRNPSYETCEVSENFKSYPYFKEWCNSQIGFNQEGWHLDKDILVKGNKIYSEDVCCFVPQEINCLFTKHGAKRGNHPIGVYHNKKSGRFVGMLSINGKGKSCGEYITAEEAFYAYKKAKEKYIQEITNKWKDEIDVRVYEALMNYEVEIND